MENLRTVTDVHQSTGIPKRTLARWAQEKRITAIKVAPRLWLISQEEAIALQGTLKPGPKPN